MERTRRFAVPRQLLFIPPVALGIVLVAFLASRAKPPERNEPTELARRLRVIELPRTDVVPRVLGHGTAKPARVWNAVSEVSGRIVELSPNVRGGAFLQPGDIACRIDPQEYALAVTRLEAEYARVEAQLGELATRADNDRDLLEIEQASLELTQLELDRLEGLYADRTAAATELRDGQLANLAQREKVQRLRNALRNNARQHTTTQAALEVTAAQLAQARLDLIKTTIAVPFACRMQDTNVEIGQYVQVGQTLFEADGTAATEIDVQVPVSAARSLVTAGKIPNIANVRDFPETLAKLGFSAIVRMRDREFTAEWNATPVRVREQLDPVTRTVQFVVQVAEPYAQYDPGIKPPLVRGTFCEVELRGAVRSGLLVVPRSAVHDGAIFVLDADNRMRRHDIVIGFEQSNFASIETDLPEGTRVVVADPTPAIDGQLVEPVNDSRVLETLIAQARAETSVR